MSWGFYGMGYAMAVAERAKQALAEQKCREPEETIKGHVGEIIQTALAALPTGTVVIINAAGNMLIGEHARGGVINSVRLEITPQSGFIE